MSNNVCTVKIAFGQEVVDALHCGRKLTKDEKKINVKKYKFSSKTKAQYFIKGIEEAVGWTQCFIISPKIL